MFRARHEGTNLEGAGGKHDDLTGDLLNLSESRAAKRKKEKRDKRLKHWKKK